MHQQTLYVTLGKSRHHIFHKCWRQICGASRYHSSFKMEPTFLQGQAKMRRSDFHEPGEGMKYYSTRLWPNGESKIRSDLTRGPMISSRQRVSEKQLSKSCFKSIIITRAPVLYSSATPRGPAKDALVEKSFIF
jgi:hypothetical protein